MTLPNAMLRLALAASMLLAVGCNAFNKPYPTKSLHAIRIPDPAPANGTPLPGTIRIDRVRVAQPFDGSPFVYRIDESRYATDYYAGFVAAPSPLLTTAISNWMAKAGLFKSVLSGGTAADYQLLLETNVTAMYGSFQPKQQPAAVLEARFFVIDQTAGQFKIIFDKAYSQSEPLESKSPNPDALIKAWNTAWEHMLTSLAADLRADAAVAAAPQAKP